MLVAGYSYDRTKRPEAPSWAPFGEYAWAGRRESMPEEGDNELEVEVFEHLRKHFASNRTGLPASTSAILSLCLALGWYTPVLHPPPHETLYRGLKFTNRQKLLNFLGVESVEDEGAIIYAEGRPIASDNGHSSSWSFRKQITYDFSEDGKRGFSVTLLADVEQNPNRFLAGPGGLYDVDGMSRWHLEKETVGLDPIRVRKIEWNRLG